MRSPHARYMNASQLYDPIDCNEGWLVSFIRRIWPRQKSVVGARLYPLTTRTVLIRNVDLLAALR